MCWVGWRVCHGAGGSLGKRPLSLRYQLSDQISQMSPCHFSWLPLVCSPPPQTLVVYLFKKIFFNLFIWWHWVLAASYGVFLVVHKPSSCSSHRLTSSVARGTLVP